MKITHLQSSTQLINLGDLKVLTDPWLTDGEYYGSWYHYPPFSKSNIDNLEYDFIYVSHIHPDHLSEQTFKSLPHKKPVLIQNYEAKFLKRKLEMFGFEVIECDNSKPFVFDNGSSITIFAAEYCNPELCGKLMGCGVVEKKFGSTSIDTLALFQMGNQSILNTNDCPYELASETIKANNLHNSKIDLLLVGYAGAGPYPQCFEFDTLDEKLLAAKGKQDQFLRQAIKYIELLKPVAFSPFAGTYTLGSRMSDLNDYRGVPLVSYATKFLNDELNGRTNGLLLEQFDSYDLDTKYLQKSEKKYPLSREDHASIISKKFLDYDYDDWDDDELCMLIQSAYKRFKQKAEEIGFKSDTKIVIKSDRFAFQLSTESEVEEITLDENLVEPFVRMTVDHNLLHRLLRGPRFAHWNNAEIGSHIKYLRRPNQFERELYYCMCFLHS